MRIIFIFNLAFKNPQFYELVEKLAKTGKEILVYDFISSKQYNPITKETTHFNPFFGARLILKIKYIRRIFIPFINKKVIKREFKKNDVVNIHYLNSAYVQYAEIIKKHVGLFVLTFWGSDLLRASEKTLRKYVPLLEHSDKISMSRGSQKYFLKIFPEYEEKLRIYLFGLSVLEIIRNLDDHDINNFKNKFKLKKEGLIYLTLGYNASPAQQHSLLIDILAKIKKEVKNKIFLLVPLTYGGDNNYKKNILKKLDETEINYRVFTNYLNNKELAALRIISNITLNIQRTDAFSASISESLMANNIVLVGDWLPYDIYDQWGVKIFKSNLDEYENNLFDIIINYDQYYQQIKGNREKVYKKLSWGAILPQWQKLLYTK